MYVLPKDVRDMEAHKGLRALMADGRLTLVVWDEFPWHEVGGAHRRGAGCGAPGSTWALGA